MSSLLELALAERNLIDAWRKVWENGGAPGVDGVTLQTFAKTAVDELHRLRREVRAGSYVADRLREVELPRSGRAPRLLAIPTVRDRVLQTAVAQILAPVLDPHFADESFAYRPGRSVPMAVARVTALRDRGLCWVVDADIEDYFDSIPHDRLFEKLAEALPDHSLEGLLQAWIGAPALVGMIEKARREGVPQGSPLSPLLSNLYLDPFDDAIREMAVSYVRYADDFVLLCATYDEAEAALEAIDARLVEAGLVLNFAKTRITSFAAGFEFLGVVFEGKQVSAASPGAEPWVLPQLTPLPAGTVPMPDASLETRLPASPKAARGKAASPQPEAAGTLPLLRTLHLAEPGAYLHRRGGRIVVSRGEEDLLEVPLEQLDQVCATTEGAVSFGVLREFLQRKVGFVVLGRAMEPAGWMEDLTGQNVTLHQAQFRRADDREFGLAAARGMVCGKIANCRVVLRRYARFHPSHDAGADEALATMQRKAGRAADLDQLRGIEGGAARRYFAALGKLLGDEWGFSGRNRRPPRDPVNVLLSYGYAVLFQNVLTLLARRGLNPHVGALHAIASGRAALACDLMEEFRPLIVDVVVLRCLLNKVVCPQDFSHEEDGVPCRLGGEGKRRFVNALEEKLEASLRHPVNQRQTDYRRAIAGQVTLWARCVTGEARAYHPFVLH